MWNSTFLLCFLIITILPISNSSAQNKRQLWEISAYSNQPNMVAVLDTISNDTLYVFAFNNRFGIEIDSIKYLKKIEDPKHLALTGTFLGMIGGGVIGNRIAKNSANEEGMFHEIGNWFGELIGTGVGIVIGGIFGAAVGSSLDHPKVINYETRTIDQKIDVLLKLMNEK